MKKLLAVALSLAMLCSLAACSGDGDSAQTFENSDAAGSTTSVDGDTSADVDTNVGDTSADSDTSAGDDTNTEDTSADTSSGETIYFLGGNDFELNITDTYVYLDVTGESVEIINECIAEEDYLKVQVELYTGSDFNPDDNYAYKDSDDTLAYLGFEVLANNAGESKLFLYISKYDEGQVQMLTILEVVEITETHFALQGELTVSINNENFGGYVFEDVTNARFFVVEGNWLSEPSVMEEFTF